jgi:hypothetical protein
VKRLWGVYMKIDLDVILAEAFECFSDDFFFVLFCELVGERKMGSKLKKE